MQEAVAETPITPTDDSGRERLTVQVDKSVMLDMADEAGDRTKALASEGKIGSVSIHDIARERLARRVSAAA